MNDGPIVMLLLIRNNRRDCSDRLRIVPAQNDQLLLEMPKHDGLDRRSRRSDRASTHHTRDQAKNIASDPTEKITPTSWTPAPNQLRAKDLSMSLFMRPELAQLANEALRSQPRNRNLRGIDVDRAMLAGMIHLDDAIAKTFGWSALYRQCGLQLCAVRLANRIERSIAETRLPQHL
jgi:hypothetical protein